MQSPSGLLDTSVLIAHFGDVRTLDLPEAIWISVLTLAELRTGVLLAKTERVRAQRLELLTSVERRFEPLPIDRSVANQFALIRAETVRKKHKPKIVDALIAATAIVNELTLYTHDRDFRTIAGLDPVFI